MDNGRRLSWIAIGLAALALVISVGGRFQTARMMHMSQYGYNQAPYGQQAPSDRWQNNNGPGGWHGQQDGFQGPFSDGRFGDHTFGRGPFHGGPFFFAPFFFLGGLVKLIGLGLVVWLVARILRNRRNDTTPPPAGPESYS